MRTPEHAAEESVAALECQARAADHAGVEVAVGGALRAVARDVAGVAHPVVDEAVLPLPARERGTAVGAGDEADLALDAA